jgi:hypothetical protein
MSIGPIQKKEIVEISTARRVKIALKKGAEEFFKSPLYYLFYTMLAATIIGLFFDKDFSWPYYLILIILASIEAKKKLGL